MEIRVTEGFKGLGHKGFKVFRAIEVFKGTSVYRAILEIKVQEEYRGLLLEL